MMTKSSFLLLAVLAVGASASACDSCKLMVQNFIDAPKNPAKMAQMKVSLRSLCAGTIHQDDCFKTTEKLDIIALKLSPFLKDTEAVCSKLQMCGESPSEIATLASLFLRKSNADLSNDNIARRQICEECKMSSSKIHTVIAAEETMQMAKHAVQRFVCRGAGQYQKACNLLAHTLVPEIFEELGNVLSDGEAVCGDMNLCEQSKKTFVAQRSSKSLDEIMRSFGVVKTSNGEELMSCFECTLSIDALLEEFINNRQGTADDIQKPICAKAVEAWHDGCEDFFHMYLSTVLYLTYNQFDGRGVCTMMHTCEKKQAELGAFSTIQTKLERCQAVESFFAKNAMDLQQNAAEAIASNVCGALPTSFNDLCSRSAHRVSAKLFDRAGKLASGRAICPLVA